MRHTIAALSGLGPQLLCAAALGLAATLVFALCAAASPEPPAAPKAEAAQGAEGRPALAPGTIIKLPEGKVVSFDEMMRDLRHMRIVYLGESHDNPAHHANQLAVIRGLQERVGSVAIGMEMFQRPFQPILDAWVAGKLDEDKFVDQSEWYDRWSMDFELYQPILEDAKATGERVLALNAPEELVKVVGSKGISGLSPEQKAQLPDMDLCKEDHRHFIEHLYEGHGGGNSHHQSNFDNFYQAQALWDETMAQTVAGFLASPEATQTVAVIAGNGHLEYGLGIPEDVVRRTGAPYRVVSMQEAERVTWGPGPGPPTPLFDYGRPLAHYVWLTASAEEQPQAQRPKLGIIVVSRKGETPAAGVKVSGVMKGGPAEKTGLKEGDVILAADGREVNSLGDLRSVLSKHKMGDKIKLTIEREGKRREVDLTLSPLPPMHRNS